MTSVWDDGQLQANVKPFAACSILETREPCLGNRKTRTPHPPTPQRKRDFKYKTVCPIHDGVLHFQLESQAPLHLARLTVNLWDWCLSHSEGCLACSHLAKRLICSLSTGRESIDGRGCGLSPYPCFDGAVCSQQALLQSPLPMVIN